MHYDDEDPFVPIWEGPYIDAELVRMRIEEMHIPVDFGDALLPGHARVEVPRSYLAEVRDVIAGTAATWPDVSDVGPGGGVRMKPAIKLGARVMVVYLVIALVIGTGLMLAFVWH